MYCNNYNYIVIELHSADHCYTNNSSSTQGASYSSILCTALWHIANLSKLANLLHTYIECFGLPGIADKISKYAWS